MNAPSKPEELAADLLDIDSDLESDIDKHDTGLLPCGFPERESAELLESLFDDQSSSEEEEEDLPRAHTTPIWAGSTEPSFKKDEHEMWTLLQDIKSNPERFTHKIAVLRHRGSTQSMQARIVGL